EVVSGSAPALIRGGWRPGSERKLCTGDELLAESLAADARPRLVLAEGEWFGGASEGGTATLKEKRNVVARGSPEAVPAAGEARTAVTCTCSPAMNGWSGMNAVPAPSGSQASSPVWCLLTDPATLTDWRSDGASEEKMIWDIGEASGVPGKGTTWRATAAPARPVSSVKPTTITMSTRKPRPRSPLRSTPTVLSLVP